MHPRWNRLSCVAWDFIADLRDCLLNLGAVRSHAMTQRKAATRRSAGGADSTASSMILRPSSGLSDNPPRRRWSLMKHFTFQGEPT